MEFARGEGGESCGYVGEEASEAHLAGADAAGGMGVLRAVEWCSSSGREREMKREDDEEDAEEKSVDEGGRG